ncbi:MAG: glucose-6-phosphate dehydrogenase, partial [Proteobacteria bacterium]|nr:glucose-6-phosphate dehydrogenase [Pseudomonadota bacterium]
MRKKEEDGRGRDEKAGYTAKAAASDRCSQERPTDPCIFVILGASGDLTSRKLIPALYSLHRKGGLPEPFRVVGCGRTPLTDESFRENMAPDEKEAESWKDFSRFLHYVELIYDSEESYRHLADYLKKMEGTARTAGNRIFYLAIPMFLYPEAVEMLGASGLAGPEVKGGWTRLVVEKPYGSDRKSAAELDEVIHRS